jgi:hypothetical protein
MPRLRDPQPYKGPFIDDQAMSWLDLPLEQRHLGLEPDIFRLADVEDAAEAARIAAQFRLKQNPWKTIPRYQVLQQGQKLDGTSWRYLCITVGAGTGKTMATEQAEYLLAAADSQTLNIFLEFSELKQPGVNGILGTGRASATSDQSTPLLIRKLQQLKLNGQLMPASAAWDLLQRQIVKGKLTLIVDAVDQFAGDIDKARATAIVLREFLQRYPQIRCVVSGRPYAVKRYWHQLFADLPWDYVQLGPFTEQQCIRRVGRQKWDWAKRLGTIRMGIPRWLDVLQSTPVAELGDDVRTLSDLYLKSLESLIRDARHEQVDALDEDSAWYLFALLAFEMVTDPKGPYRGQGAGIDRNQIDEFKYRVWDEQKTTPADHDRPARLRAAFADYESFDRKLGQLGALNEMLDDPVIAGNDDDPAELKQVFWRDQTLQDMFAALWMTRWATESDKDKLRSHLFVRWKEDTRDYEDMWRLATEMPATRRGRKDAVYVQSMSVLYEPSTLEKPAVRSTEMIWRSWPVMLQLCGLLKKGDWQEEELKPLTRQLQQEARQFVESGMTPLPTASSARDVLLRFLCEYRLILRGSRGSEAQRICEDFESWFVLIDPHAADWWPGEKDVDGQPLPIVSGRYSIAKYTMTNEQFQLFEGELAARYAAYSVPLHNEKNEPVYLKRSRVPVVAINWHDAWCVALWYGSELPHEQEWEYACRAGRRSRYSVGDGETLTAAEAYLANHWDALPIEVDAFAFGNSWGLYQMHANVFEWCENRYETERSSRCLRGGCFNWEGMFCLSADRFERNPATTDASVGVRLSRAARD